LHVILIDQKYNSQIRYLDHGFVTPR